MFHTSTISFATVLGCTSPSPTAPIGKFSGRYFSLEMLDEGTMFRTSSSTMVEFSDSFSLEKSGPFSSTCFKAAQTAHEMRSGGLLFLNHFLERSPKSLTSTQS